MKQRLATQAGKHTTMIISAARCRGAFWVRNVGGPMILPAQYATIYTTTTTIIFLVYTAIFKETRLRAASSGVPDAAASSTLQIFQEHLL